MFEDLNLEYQIFEIDSDAYDTRRSIAGKRSLRVKVDNRDILEVLKKTKPVSLTVNGMGYHRAKLMTVEDGIWDDDLKQGSFELSSHKLNEDYISFLNKIEANRPDLVIKGVQRASPEQASVLSLTLRPYVLQTTGTSLEQLIPDLTKYLEGGKRIIEDVGAWLEQRSVALDVVDAEHVPQMAIMRTKSSATPGVSFEISSSKDEMYTYYDVGGMDFDNLIAHAYASEYPNDHELSSTPIIESISNVNLVLHLEEIKQKQIELTQRQLMSVYNSVEKHLVCSNEKIHKIMRKKKYGKCIYRIVVKHGVAARQAAYGKYQNCTLYLDDIQPWN